MPSYVVTYECPVRGTVYLGTGPKKDWRTNAQWHKELVDATVYADRGYAEDMRHRVMCRTSIAGAVRVATVEEEAQIVCITLRRG